MIKKLILKRVAQNEYATFGVFIYQLAPICVSLELPWRDNKNNVSCIPEGTYICRKVNDDLWRVENVPGRLGIQIEVGNCPSEIRGCILPGSEFEPIGTEYAVRGSRRSVREISKAMKNAEHFELRIIGAHRDEYVAL